MATKDKIAAKAAPYLEDGEVVQQAFKARVMIPGTKMSKANYVVVATQRSVLILQVTIWTTTTPKKLTARIPRDVPISLERAGGLWWRMQLGDHTLMVAGKRTLAEARHLVNVGEQSAA